MPSSRSTTLATLGWAAFLGCSWTWCIGMFLPVLMVRDFGFMGWVVFAAPNVVGAAAMGWVLVRPGAAQQIVANHKVACLSFSAVTVAFHLFFAAWLVRGLVGWIGPMLVLIGAALVYLLTYGGLRELVISTIVLLFSICAFGFALAKWGLPIQVFDPAVRNGPRLLCLAPVCVFGFALCPYLDLTFLRARAMTAPRAGIAAFTLGFGVFFFLMILFTLWYARWLLPGGLERIPKLLAWIIGAHICLQSAFTIALHSRPLFARDAGKALTSIAVLACVIAFAIPLVWQGELSGLSPRAAVNGEIVYRLFLGFYGLVFPAYVWLCMFPMNRAAAAPGKRNLIVFAIAVVVAAPMFYLGFIDNRMIWLLPGVTIVLAAGLLIRTTV